MAKADRISQAASDIASHMKRHGLGVTEAIQRLWREWQEKFSGEEKTVLMQEGLRYRVNGNLTSERHPETGFIRVQVSQRINNPIPQSVLVSVAYVVSGGMKLLIDITAEEYEEAAQQMRQKADGLIKVAAWMNNAAEALRSAGVKSIRKLPVAAQKQLAAKWPG